MRYFSLTLPLVLEKLRNASPARGSVHKAPACVNRNRRFQCATSICCTDINSTLSDAEIHTYKRKVDTLPFPNVVLNSFSKCTLLRMCARSSVGQGRGGTVAPDSARTTGAPGSPENGLAWPEMSHEEKCGLMDGKTSIQRTLVM